MGATDMTKDYSTITSASVDSIMEEHEQMEELLEGLLIFPNLSGLRRGYEKTESLFEHEQQMLLRVAMPMDSNDHTADHSTNFKEACSTIRESQKKILEIFRKEMNDPSPGGNACTSCWDGPKKIEKGIDKNTANRLAAAFERHAEQFQELCDKYSASSEL